MSSPVLTMISLDFGPSLDFSVFWASVYGFALRLRSPELYTLCHFTHPFARPLALSLCQLVCHFGLCPIIWPICLYKLAVPIAWPALVSEIPPNLQSGVVIRISRHFHNVSVLESLGSSPV